VIVVIPPPLDTTRHPHRPPKLTPPIHTHTKTSTRHCTHHAFPTSARHGLEWYELDPTWWLISFLQAVGLAWDVKLPSEKAKALKRKQAGPAAATATAVVRAGDAKQAKAAAARKPRA
jgi:hypothetical protein